MDESRAGLLDRLAGGPARIAEAVRHAAADESRSVAHAGWTARENVAHLVLVERVVFQARLDQLAGGGIPEWAWTEPGTSDGPDVATLDAALDSLAVARSETVARVAALDDAGWQRFGRHAAFGQLDVAGLLGVVTDHDDQHLGDIRARHIQDATR